MSILEGVFLVTGIIFWGVFTIAALFLIGAGAAQTILEKVRLERGSSKGRLRVVSDSGARAAEREGSNAGSTSAPLRLAPSRSAALHPFDGGAA